MLLTGPLSALAGVYGQTMTPARRRTPADVLR